MIERVAPATWHGVAGLEPRAYYSTTSRRRRWRQRAVSTLKVTVKRTAIRIGHHQRMELDELVGHLGDLLARLEGLGVPVFLVGDYPVDARLFPGTGAAFRRIAAIERELVRPMEHVRFCRTTWCGPGGTISTTTSTGTTRGINAWPRP